MAELTRRYIVMPMATEAPFDLTDPEAVFVLKPWKDPAALEALEAYGRHCYPELARDLADWVKAIRSGPVTRGGVGERNALYLASRRAPAPARKPPAAAGHGPAKKAQVKRKRMRVKPGPRKRKKR